MCGCLSHASYWGPGPQHRHVPWPGIEPATLRSKGRHSIHWATPARAKRQYLLSKLFLFPSEAKGPTRAHDVWVWKSSHTIGFTSSFMFRWSFPASVFTSIKQDVKLCCCCHNVSHCGLPPVTRAGPRERTHTRVSAPWSWFAGDGGGGVIVL